MRTLTVQEKITYALHSGPEYQAYWPRFIVGIRVGDRYGDVEVLATDRWHKMRQRDELEAMTVRSVVEKALSKAAAGHWLNKPSP